MSTPEQQFHHRLSKAKRRSRVAPTLPKYAISLPGAIEVDAYSFTMYGATYQVRRDINIGDTIAIDLSNTPDIIFMCCDFTFFTYLKFGTPSAAPWGDLPFSGSSAGGVGPDGVEEFSAATPPYHDLIDTNGNHSDFSIPWLSTTNGKFRSYHTLTNTVSVAYTNPLVNGLFGPQALQEDFTINFFQFSPTHRPHAGWVFWDYTPDTIPNTGINLDYSGESTDFTRIGETIVQTIPGAIRELPSRFFRTEKYYTNTFDVLVTRKITAPCAIVFMCLAFSETAPITDLQKYPTSISDNSTAPGLSNRLTGRVSESLIGPLRRYRLAQIF